MDRLTVSRNPGPRSPKKKKKKKKKKIIDHNFSVSEEPSLILPLTPSTTQPIQNGENQEEGCALLQLGST
jgi:hypothetical protein